MKFILIFVSVCLTGSAMTEFPNGAFQTNAKETSADGTVRSYSAQHVMKGNSLQSLYDLGDAKMELDGLAAFDKVGFFTLDGVRRFTFKTGQKMETKLTATGFCGDVSCSFDFKETDGTAGHETFVINGDQMFRTGAYTMQGQKYFWEESGKRD